jgi:uncharacterized protein
MGAAHATRLPPASPSASPSVSSSSARPDPRPPGAPAGWQVLLALVSLLLSGLLWINGLVGSLDRPSVGNALTLRQLQLQLLAAPALPEQLRPLLTGADPEAALAAQLQQQRDADPGPGAPDPLLQQALLQRRQGDDAALRQQLQHLEGQVPPAQRPLLLALQAPAGQPPSSSAELISPWASSLSPLTRQLLCEELNSWCPVGPQRQAALRLLAVSWLPALLLLLGLGLGLREIWLLWRRRLPIPPLEGPRLNLVDVTLLIAGGFVLLGELSVPLLLTPLSRLVLAPLAASPVRQQSLQVVLLYLGLMVAPLLILWSQLRAIAGPAPAAGWLQWRWRPVASLVSRACAQLLMVLPLVALGSWLVERLVGDPGGSNPLLELVLSAGDPFALVGFGFTAIVLAPLFEETLFRGVLLPVLGQRWGAGPGVLASALVFGLAHLSLGELVPLTVLGMGLGWLRLRSGRLAPCVLMHALWNGLTFTNLVLLAG